MGGFTQPRHLAFLNPLDKTRKEKDSYAVRVGDSRIRPSTEAYEPHLVYLCTTRYPVRWGHGRATRREVFSGFCKESEFKARLIKLNAGILKDDGTWLLDNDVKDYLTGAVWPGSPEARSLENKYRKQLAKQQDDDPTDDTPSDAASLAPIAPTPTIEGEAPTKRKKKQVKFDILPPVLDFVRPLPPYDNPSLIMPFLTVTLPTRPLASTLSRLCNSHPRGLPFYASIPDKDRKDGPSFFRRLLRMRTDRIRELSETLVDRLEGNGGGLFGLRLNAEDRGRGIEGEALAEGLAVPEKGWAQLRWLEDGSEGWNGLEQVTLMESWEQSEGINLTGRWSEYGDTEGIEMDEPKPFISSLKKAVQAKSVTGGTKTPEELRELLQQDREAVQESRA